ncbi:MAG TPA: hypothetical protein VNT42_06355 [Sphingomonas sp.]|nr:hypothetical protein [Sphingomonas sp.]
MALGPLPLTLVGAYLAVIAYGVIGETRRSGFPDWWRCAAGGWNK